MIQIRKSVPIAISQERKENTLYMYLSYSHLQPGIANLTSQKLQKQAGKGGGNKWGGSKEGRRRSAERVWTGKMGKGSQKVQTSLYMSKLLRVNLKSSPFMQE